MPHWKVGPPRPLFTVLVSDFVKHYWNTATIFFAAQFNLLDGSAAMCALIATTLHRVTRIALVRTNRGVQYARQPADSAGREGIMDELIARLVDRVGVDRTAAEKSVGIIFDFLRKEGPADKVQALLDRVPGAQALMEAQSADSGGMFSMGGIMGAGTRMMAAGLNMSQVQGVAREVLAFAREKAGEDAVGEIVGAVPGLSQFI